MKGIKIILNAFFALMFLFSIRGNAQLLDSLGLDTMRAVLSIEEGLKNPDAVIKLELRKQKLNDFPMEILQFKNLQYLDLSKNRIKEIPEAIDTLKYLQVFIMSKNKLEYLPKEIGNLSNLKYLNLNQNELYSLPAQMGKLDQLISLDLWSNNIDTFPEELIYMRSLKELDLRVILISDNEQERLREMFPKANIYFSKNCNCEL